MPRNPTAGTVRAEEQSKVPLVWTLMTVGIFALAMVTRGAYPPFALISITCFPSTMEVFACPVELAGVLPPRRSIKMPPTARTMTTREPMIILFIGKGRRELEAKDRIDNASSGQRIDEIEDGKKDHD